MILWWIGNIVLVAVIAPVVVFLLLGVLTSAKKVGGALDDIAGVGATMVADLAPVPQLVTTVSLVSETNAAISRYGAALDELL